MSQAVFEKILDLLKARQIDFRLFQHKPVYTSEQAARVRGTKIKEGAKALIFLADKQPIMIVLAGDKKADTKKFKETYKIKDLRMATPEEVEQLTEGVEVGAVHPFGNLHNLSVFVDESLSRSQKIVFNAGLHTHSVQIRYKDYLRLVNPVIGIFSI